MLLCKNNGLSYKPRTNDWIVVKLMHRVDIDATLKVTKGQGHMVNLHQTYTSKKGKFLAKAMKAHRAGAYLWFL